MSDRIGGIGDIGASMQNALLERAGRVAGRVQERRGLASDLLESDDEYLVVFDAPGAVSTDVQVRYVEGSVEVRIDRFRDYREGFEMRFPGRGLSLEGTVDLPADAVVDPDAATATLTDHGTLEVRLPKDPDAVPVESDQPRAADRDDDPIGVDVGGGESASDGDDTDAAADADADEDADNADGEGEETATDADTGDDTDADGDDE